MLSFIIRTISRLLIGGYFVLTALVQLLNWDIGEKELFEGLSFWETHLPKEGLLGTVVVEVFQAPTVLIGLSFGTSFVLGALLIVGIRPGLCVIILSITKLLSTTFFHPFWFFDGTKFTSELMVYAQNVAILGGLFMHFSKAVQAPPTYREDDGGGYRMSFRDDE